MAMTSFSDFPGYGIDPWSNIETNERVWYDPLLRDTYMRNSVYSQFATFKVDLNGPRARQIFFNEIIPPRPNIAPIGNRQMEASRLYSDSYQKDVTTQRYGNGMLLHRESTMFQYWQSKGGGTGTGLMPYLMNVSGGISQVIVDHLDLLARNAYLSHPAPLFGLNNGSGFGAISDTDTLNTELLDEVRLYFNDTPRPFSAVAQKMHRGGGILCLTTAGGIHDLMREVNPGNGTPTFVDVQKYQDDNPVLRGEIGMWRGIRFIDSPMAKLWNCGSIDVQTEIKAALAPGDGAADPETTKIEGSRRVGQPGATHFVLVDDATGIEPNMTITIHRLRHDATSLEAYANRGVLNGVIYDDPMAQDVEVHAVDTSGGAGAHKIILKEPYMMTDHHTNQGKGLETDLGGGVYGYVTLGAPIHTALFMTPESTNAIVAGVAQSPALYTPRPIDDYESVYRLSYDFWLKYAIWEARNFGVLFFRGANRGFGRRIFR